jgi:hypothetical protein
MLFQQNQQPTLLHRGCGLLRDLGEYLDPVSHFARTLRMSRDSHMSSLRHVGPGTLGASNPKRSLVVRLDCPFPARAGDDRRQSMIRFGVRRPMYGEAMVVLVDVDHRDRSVC